MTKLELIRAMKRELEEYHKDVGGCDHKVGICVCTLSELILEAGIALGEYKRCRCKGHCRKCGGTGVISMKEGKK